MNKKVKRIVFLFFVILFVISGVLLMTYFYVKNNGLNNANNKSNKNNIIFEEPLINVIDQIPEKTYQELRKNNNINNPNIASKNIKEEILKDIKRTKTNNIELTYSKNNLKSPVDIIQGDSVTWENKSSDSIEIKGLDDWGSNILIESSKRYTQAFYFIGKYEYEILDENKNILSTGSIIVSPPVEEGKD